MIAMLGMYDRPEVADANDAFWSSIRSKLGYGPKFLTRDRDFWEIWRSPDLLFAQTCGLPYRSKLHGSVQLIGTPDYGLEDCPPGYYRSAIVARKNSLVDLAELGAVTLAYNEQLSQSGWAAFWGHVGPDIELGTLKRSGGHANSAKMVAEGDADLACLDALTWSLIHKFDDFAEELEVLEWTDPTPGLPYITSVSRDADEISDAVRQAITELNEVDRDLLHLKGLVDISSDEYLAIPMPPE